MSYQLDLAEGFRNHQDTIIAKWVDYALSTYSSSSFFKKETDQFANPIGGNFRQAFADLFPLLLKGASREEYQAPLEQFASVRAVQEFTPSQALAPLNAVKHIAREVFQGDKERKHLVEELYDFDFAVDVCMLTAFDIYMQYRERLYLVRIEEIRSGTHVLTDSKCPSKFLKEEKGKIPKIHV